MPACTIDKEKNRKHRQVIEKRKKKVGEDGDRVESMIQHWTMHPTIPHFITCSASIHVCMYVWDHWTSLLIFLGISGPSANQNCFYASWSTHARTISTLTFHSPIFVWWMMTKRGNTFVFVLKHQEITLPFFFLLFLHFLISFPLY